MASSWGVRRVSMSASAFAVVSAPAFGFGPSVL